MKRSLAGLCLSLAACGGAAEYTCPDPIGRIVRDDCEVYRTRYETLKVELGASLGPVGASVALGQQQLREVSELLQVLGHRTYALCRDFNGCRVPPPEYRERRERTDRVFAAVAAIQGQLKEASLDAESRAKLVQALVDALREDRPSPSPRSTGATTTRVRARRERYAGYLPWYGARLLPPQPSTPAGYPRLLWVGADLEASWRRKGDSRREVHGYRPQVELGLLGKVQPDDMLVASWNGGSAKTEVPVRGRTRNGILFQTLKAPEEIGLTGPSFSVEILFRRGGDGKQASLGKRTYPVVSSREPKHGRVDVHYGVNLDPLAGQGRLVFRPYGGALPADFDQPCLVVVLKLRKHRETTARCWVDGKVLGRALLPSRNSGQEDTFQDRPRFESISPGRSRGVADPFVQWWRYDFPLPLALPRGSAAPPDKLDRWPRSGRWRCVVSVDGEPARELTFHVGRDGRPDALPEQTEISRADWLVKTRVLKNPVEVPLGTFHTLTANGPTEDKPAQPATRFSARVGRRRGSLNTGQIERALAPIRDALRRCVEQEQTGGTFVLRAHVYPNGRSGANVPTEIDPWLRSCFSSAMGKGEFPRARDYTYFDVEVRAAGPWRVASAGPLRVWNVRGALSASRVLRALGSAVPALRACGSRGVTTRMKLAVGKDGAVEVPWWGGGHPAVQGCLKSELGKLRLPASEQLTTLTLELRLR